MRSHRTMIPCACGCGTLIPSQDKCYRKRTYVNGHYWRGRSRAGQRRITPVLERFWAKVEKTPTCWVWTAACIADGYGSFALARGRMVKTHQYSWQIHNGPIPDGLWVLHTCDNRRCVNPAHLYLGTRMDNVHDMMSRGRNRQPKGEAHPGAKLTEQDVLAIRARLAKGEICRTIAADYAVTEALIGHIHTRRIWKHIP